MPGVALARWPALQSAGNDRQVAMPDMIAGLRDGAVVFGAPTYD